MRGLTIGKKGALNGQRKATNGQRGVPTRQCQVDVQVLTWVQKLPIFGKPILRTKIRTLRFLD